MKYLKHLTVKEWKRFDRYTGDFIDGEELTAQEIMLDKYKIILTDHQTRSEKMHKLYQKIKHVDIDKSLTKVSSTIDDFSKMMDSMKGIGGKQTDLSGLLNTKKTQKKGILSL